jgi:nitronate monooxygenase
VACVRFARLDEVANPRFDFEHVIPPVLASLRSHGIDEATVPIIPAGGINSPARVRELFALGARGVQLGTAFAVTEDEDAAPAFKAVLANATADDLVEFISVAGLPARAVRTPWLDSYLRHFPALQAVARRKPRCTLHFDCLANCGLRDGIAHIGQFCIDTQVAAALRGDVRRGLFFSGAARRGAAAVRFTDTTRSRSRRVPARRFWAGARLSGDCAALMIRKPLRFDAAAIERAYDASMRGPC